MTMKPPLTPLTPAVHEEPLSAVAFAVVRAYEQINRVRAVEAANDAYVELGFDRSEAATVADGNEGGA